MKEEYISAEEAAKLIGLHPATLRKLAWQRRIRSFKVLARIMHKSLEKGPI